MTAPAQVAPTKNRYATTLARAKRDVQDSWAAASSTGRIMAVAAAFAALVSSAGGGVPLASGLTVGVLTSAALVDWHARRLPDVIVLAAAAVFAIAWAVAPTSSRIVPLTEVALGVAVFAGPLLVLHLAAPGAMGFGDVKAAAVLGMAIGAVAWGLAVWALIAAAASTALAGTALRRSTLPFGPGLVAGALASMLTVAMFGLDTIGF